MPHIVLAQQTADELIVGAGDISTAEANITANQYSTSKATNVNSKISAWITATTAAKASVKTARSDLEDAMSA